MAISATSVWEVRPTVGSNNNGGFFVPGASGTDYSQQTSPQYALSGLTSSGAGSVLLTASAAADMVGNGLQVTSGTNATQGIYQITAVSVGVSITVDRAVTTGVGASIVVNIGGSMASTVPIITRSINSTTQGVDGNIIYIKATGSMVLSATQADFDVKVFQIIGYTTTRGDNGQATITTATNSVQLFQANNSQQEWGFFNINFTSTAGTRAEAINENTAAMYYVFFQNCTFDGVLSALKTSSQTHHVGFYKCEIKNCTSSTAALNLISVMHYFVDCYIHDNTGDGVRLNGTSNSGVSGAAVFVNTVIKSNGGKNVNNIGDQAGNGAISMLFVNCDILNATSDGINFQGSGTNFGQMLGLINTVIDSNGGFGVNMAASLASGTFALQYGASNFYRSNSSGARSNMATLPGDVAGSADPFTNRSSADFTLNSTAGGGAACKAAGYPGTIPGTSGAGSADIGALQSAGGSTVNNFVPAQNIFIFDTEGE